MANQAFFEASGRCVEEVFGNWVRYEVVASCSPQVLPVLTSTSSGTRGPSSSEALSTSSIPSIIAFSKQASTASVWSWSHSMTISSCTARTQSDPGRAGRATGADALPYYTT